MKKDLRLFVILISIFLICSSNKNMNNSVNEDFNFKEIFYNLKISKKIKLIRCQETDFYLANIYTCKVAFYKDIVKKRSYYLMESNKINNIVVTEYIFSNSISAKKAFEIADEYANYLRKLERKNYNKRCYDIWDEQLYYAVSKENHVYILTTLDNLNFTEVNNSVDNIFNNTKEILLDDFYNEFK